MQRIAAYVLSATVACALGVGYDIGAAVFGVSMFCGGFVAGGETYRDWVRRAVREVISR